MNIASTTGRAAVTSALCGIVLAAPAGRAEAQEAFATIYPSLSLTSDYRYNGVSYSDRHAVAYGQVHAQLPDGFYAGGYASQVDFNDVGDTSYEIDVYAGRGFGFRGTQFRIETMYSAFPDKTAPGPTYDFLTTTFAAHRSAGGVTYGGAVAWVPESSFETGEAWRMEADAAWQVSDALALKGIIGRRWIEIGSDRIYWSLGAVTSYRNIGFEVAYVGTDLSRAECGGSDGCEPGLMATVTWSFDAIGIGGD